MKHIITFVLRVCVFLLLSLFAYQKITGRSVDGSETRRKIDEIVLKARNNIRLIQVHTGVIKNSSTEIVKNTSNVIVPKLKEDIQWNINFLANLKIATQDYRTSIGKWDVYAERISSNDNRRDAVSVTVSWNKLWYPAKYNMDNAFAIDNNFNDRIYTNSGIQLLYVDGLHSVFYKAQLPDAWQRGIIQNVEQGTSIMMDGLTPLLYYKNKYLFTLQEYDKQKSLFVLNNSNELQTLWWWSIENLAIDADIVAFQDTDQWLLYFLWLDNLKILKTIRVSTGTTFQWFVVDGSYIRIRLQDNVAKKNLFQKRARLQ